MKKYILSAGILLVATFALAQSNTSFGFKAGMTNSTIKGDAVSSLNSILDYTNGAVTTKSLTGFYAGGFANIPLSDNLSFEPGLYYSQKGYVLNGELNLKGLEFAGINAKAKLQSSFIDLPVLLKVNVDGLQVFAGPQFSYLAGSNLRTTAGLLGVNLLDKTIDVSNQFNKWDAAITGGVGYSFSRNLTVTASYDYGLSKVDKNRSIKSNIQTFKVGLAFKL